MLTYSESCLKSVSESAQESIRDGPGSDSASLLIVDCYKSRHCNRRPSLPDASYDSKARSSATIHVVVRARA
ncbi:hypothetical protein VTN49DRAFT_4884 [Thermomyces lanuginosus]|uniref:uncharacterized protein n=1 Tax=Thermomyces lanuginosus TaxID=5541 RepID=UPI003743F18A